MSEKLKTTVNKQVANWTVLYVKLHNYHWYVKGKDFFTLHEKFEEFYNEAAVYIDDLAERLLAMQGSPVATMKECLEVSTIKEADGSETAEQMVQNIYNDFSTVAEELKTGIELAEEVNDETTGDMFLAIHQVIEKHNWMLKAYLG
ncbi:DNA starvation/stationary phase protection protein [Bacillus sp. CLL-7-23]|uniref:DNA starvation/stationary phase protection protein n=1 Tax=Bacillus changyiensis TaxID=3004103 RepID=A0ABT4X6H7_9BACI|nr:Dps family protein [Bacillus changyiensis]MDA1477718.1 DNA starvation/stationary phase protection protein [Bacillus changyiensis]MDA7027329.1 DNA starvation/stationary phase protection protein [Bacillus changyiensis]